MFPDLIHWIRPTLPYIVSGIGLTGLFGLSMIFASSSDVISCLTMHIDIVYSVIRAAFKAQLTLARSLFDLFRGKIPHRSASHRTSQYQYYRAGRRHNVLRRRLDDWNFDLDQLLLGTMLFTLISFLFPTILVYYALFASVRALQRVVCAEFLTRKQAKFVLLMFKAGIQIALALVNHFPLFALTLRLKDPSRLPGLIRF